jgi:hypothetical protein
VFDTHASDASIAPGVNLGSGTVQKPLDLSMSIFRQCCAEAMLVARRNVAAISRFFGDVLIIAKCYAAASGLVRSHTNRNAATFDDQHDDVGYCDEWTLNAPLTTSNS